MIRAREVRLIGPNGDQVGILSSGEAQKYADQLELDLVEVAPEARPPVCKVMDYGKYRYEQEQKGKEDRKRQTNIRIKENKQRNKKEDKDIKKKRKKKERK